MKYPLRWLQDYVALDWDVETLSDRLTMAGFEIEAIESSAFGPVLEIEITPNRPDCLSMVGLAREIAAISGKKLVLPKSRIVQHKLSKAEAAKPSIEVEAKDVCPRYIGRLLENATVRSSPKWMQQRLEAAGVRPINNIVDITNFVLLEMGQPQHAFDFSRLSAGRIIVRRAAKRETLQTLEKQQCRLDEDVLIIADGEKPVALAGVMGGMGSEVTAETRSILLETAVFDPQSVRRTSRRYGIQTESSYRFERGIDLENSLFASERAAGLLCELSGATERWHQDFGLRKTKRKAIVIHTDRLNRWLGTGHSPAQITRKLKALDFEVAQSDDVLKVVPPAFRGDVTQAADVYEELARFDGYDRLPSTMPSMPAGFSPSLTESRYQQLYQLRERCVRAGLVEAISWALQPEAVLAQTGAELRRCIRLDNPLSLDQALLRPSLLPGLLQAARYNSVRGQADLRFFEIGSVFSAKGSREAQKLAVILSGDWCRDWRQRMPNDFYRLKGIVESLALGAKTEWEAAELKWALPGEAAIFKAGGKQAGVLGRVGPELARAYDMDQALWFAELDAEALLPEPGAKKVKPLPAHPPVKRDLSILVPAEVAFSEVRKIVKIVGGKPAERVVLADCYTGKQIEPGYYSLTFSMEYRDPKKTLTSEEADAIHQQIVAELKTRLHVQLRG